MEPVGIGGAFGWFAAGSTRRAVLLCGTFGFEQHSARRGWRDLAEAIAAGGASVLRFDYPGEGDSEGDVVALGTALGTIRRGVRFLREVAGAEEVVLVGLRLGGTLAALVAAEEGVERLVLLAPFARGRAYLREMEIQSRLIDIGPDGAPLPKDPGHLSVGGFSLEPDFRRDVATLDLRRCEQAPAPRILLLGPDPGGLAARYAAQGSRVETGDLPGLSALLGGTLTTRMPEPSRSRILDFVGGGPRPLPAPRMRPAPPGAAISGEGWREEPALFGGGLFGIGCRPDGDARRPAVLFVNMGANDHTGYGRQATTLARALAREGVPSLRMDLRGIGESADRPDGESPFYRLDAVEDVRAAVDWLARPRGWGEGKGESKGAGQGASHGASQGAGKRSDGPEARPVIVFGTCNGAYLAFHALCQDDRIAAGILVNLYCFDWELTHGGVAYGEDTLPVRHASAYAAMVLWGSTWRRILTGVTPVRAIAARLLHRGIRKLAALPGRWRRGTRSLSIAARVAQLRARGARVVLAYSAGDLGLIDLKTQLGSRERAAELLGEPVHVVPESDHTFTVRPAQELILGELLRLAQVCDVPSPAAAETTRPAPPPAPSPVPSLAA